MKTYDLVYRILCDNEQARNSDKVLMWEMWQAEEAIHINMLTYEDFIYSATSPETITRTRRQIQKLHPELRANGKVLEYREAKRRTKGTFIYNI